MAHHHAAGDVTVKPNIIAANAASKSTPLERNKEFAAALKHQEVIRNALIALMDRYQLDGIVLPFQTEIVPQRPLQGFK